MRLQDKQLDQPGTIMIMSKIRIRNCHFFMFFLTLPYFGSPEECVGCSEQTANPTFCRRECCYANSHATGRQDELQLKLIGQHFLTALTISFGENLARGGINDIPALAVMNP